MVKALIFDMGKVLIPFDFSIGYARLERHCGLPAPEIRKRIAATDLVTRFETGRIPPEQFVGELGQLLHMDIEYSHFCELWGSIFLPGPLIPEEVIESLSKRYPMLVLSNTNVLHFDFVRRRYPILRHFQSFVLSHEVGAVKPERGIYEEAIRRAGCPPEEIFYTDDIAGYVEAAQQAGIDAVQFHSAAQIEQELKSRGVSW